MIRKVLLVILAIFALVFALGGPASANAPDVRNFTGLNIPGGVGGCSGACTWMQVTDSPTVTYTAHYDTTAKHFHTYFDRYDAGDQQTPANGYADNRFVYVGALGDLETQQNEQVSVICYAEGKRAPTDATALVFLIVQYAVINGVNQAVFVWIPDDGLYLPTPRPATGLCPVSY